MRVRPFCAAVTQDLCFDAAVLTPSPGEKVAQQIYHKNKSNEFVESEEECGRCTEILYCVGTYSFAQHGRRYQY